MIIRQKKDFENFLSRTGLIRQDEIKYYVYWVIKFLNYCNYRPIKSFNQNSSPYLEQLEKDERIKEWQVTYTCPHRQSSGLFRFS